MLPPIRPRRRSPLIHRPIRSIALLLFVATLGTLLGTERPQAAETNTWWKGNLHTHSLWSDGDDFPEMIVDWYRTHGYHFLALSDHNTLLEGARWISTTNNRIKPGALARYEQRFGPTWIETRQHHGDRQVRLKPLAEFRPLFEQPNRFLLIASEEITSNHQDQPIHINATHLRYLIPTQRGTSVVDVMQRAVDAVLEQRAQTDQPMFPHVNHPNFGWGITAEDLAAVRGERFFEVYNGHPSVRDSGDNTHVSTERMWDIALARRLLTAAPEPLYGIAVDDSHHYHEFSRTNSNPGCGWIMVRAAALTPESIVHAMERGDFYASTGVVLREIQVTAEALTLSILPTPGVHYTTRFIGTLAGFDATSEPVRDAAGQPLRVTRRYSAAVGQVLEEASGERVTYRFRGSEHYVRACVISSQVKRTGPHADDVERAWTQPVFRPQPPRSATP